MILKGILRLSYRGLYELQSYALLAGKRRAPAGLTWKALQHPENGMLEVWAVLAVEWAVFMAAAWYLEQARIVAYLLIGVWLLCFIQIRVR